MRAGKATRPLRLPTKAPLCFVSQEQWAIYRELANYSAGDGFTYCSDCTPEHRDAMKAEGRCAYPGTTFGKNNGVVVGRRCK